MLPPNIKHTVRFKELNSKVTIYAYRKLHKIEIKSLIVDIIRKEKKLKKNHSYVWLTLIGATDTM